MEEVVHQRMLILDNQLDEVEVLVEVVEEHLTMDVVLQIMLKVEQETLLQQILLKVLLVVTEVLQVDMVQVAVVEQLL